MGKLSPSAFIGKSRPALFFIIATCFAIGYHFAVNQWFTESSVAHFFLPLIAGCIIFAFSHCLIYQKNKVEDIATTQAEQLTASQTEISQLRMRLVDVERNSLATQRELHQLRLERRQNHPEENSKFETTFHATPDPMLLADLESGLVTDVNESFLQLLDFAWQDVYNNAVSAIFTWANSDDAKRFANALITGKTENNLQAVSEQKSGGIFFALVSMRTVSISGKRTIIIAVRDYSDLHAAQHEIRLFSKALEQSPAGTAILSINGCVEYVNTRFTQITGYTANELHRNKVPFLENLPENTNFSWSMLATTPEWRDDIFTIRKDNTKCWLSLSISPVVEHDELSRYVLILEDITDKKEQERRIQHMAMHDGLTGVANRRQFKMQLARSIELQHRSQVPFSLAFIDLNNFKEINDSRGHDFGDEVLKRVAKRLKNILREVDLIARPGGDEFLLLLSGIQKLEDLEATLLRITYHIARQMEFHDATTIMNAAIGVAMCPEHGTNADELLSKADHAMYACKRTPNTPFIIWNPTIDMENKQAS
ncbi:diguanylate cyclase domain-containing protein [Halodesulfovibrio marinisediminis]|uniref:PAS domain S-box-containing protein/diguanylate cyclase (GGDEF) domain-containing protein n=1 Tax=Halodesulfovibrio marinisediminis DSM 17456 TaxID=1121457 RepID=A0A1N6IV38_9BACT|nr:diguanylate cyclase [Halodesulfovibrio marinisediminis]SIO35848.1 PAS domain S-box-containing protein/diguanylate cyclase (GGDEF) domain-containing protein [Halodesulfovibrio marinisediminis DSM 17456]